MCAVTAAARGRAAGAARVGGCKLRRARVRRIFERLRVILHEGAIDKRVQYLIEGVTKVRALKFEGHAAVPPGLDLIDEGDQITHQVDLEGTPLDAQARPPPDPNPIQSLPPAAGPLWRTVGVGGGAPPGPRLPPAAGALFAGVHPIREGSCCRCGREGVPLRARVLLLTVHGEACRDGRRLRIRVRRARRCGWTCSRWTPSLRRTSASTRCAPALGVALPLLPWCP
jgi:hypothetical protein